MKNMNQRTKIILAIVAVVVIVGIVVGVVMTQTPVGELFGTTAHVIYPPHPTMVVGSSIHPSVNSTLIFHPAS